VAWSDGRRPLGAALHSPDEPSEVIVNWIYITRLCDHTPNALRVNSLNDLSHDDSTINIVVVIIIIVVVVVLRFQTENNLIPPEWQAPLPVRISQPYVVLENHSGGATRPRKVWWYLYPFRYNTGVWRTDRHATTAIAALTHSVARLISKSTAPKR